LFYVSSANGVMRVGVERAASWAATTPTMLLKDGLVVSAEQNVGRNYDVTPDGQRFLVVKPVNASNEAPQLVVVQHFDEDAEAARADEVVMALAAGTRLGAYEIVGAIGAGGMGEVYRATDTNLGRQVAIKVLPEAFAQDPERVARFEREAKTLAALNHPTSPSSMDLKSRRARTPW
jgi:hypothetical protein